MKPVVRWLGVTTLFLVLAAAATLFAGLREATAPPIRRQIVLHVSGWPRTRPPLRIALFSDIHLGNRGMTDARLARIVDQVNAAEPDLVLIAGDFVNGTDASGAARSIAQLEAPLARLHARLGTVAVLGNHDHWTDPDAIRAVLRRAGVSLLSNAAVRRGPIAVLGVDDAYSGHSDVAVTLRSAAGLGGLPLVLSHSPDVVRLLPANWPLILAGHTHCGQIVLPLVGAVVEHWPFRPVYDRHLRCGPVRYADHLAVVTAGVGSGELPIRIGAPPDWWLITLGPSDATPSNG